MIDVIERALERVRRREYVKCFQSALEIGKDENEAKELCSTAVDMINRFTIADFESEAYIWIQENNAWEYKVSSLVRRLRSWAKREHVVKRIKPSVYEVVTRGR